LLAFDLVPGTLVRLVSQPEWGVGRVQSLIGDRLTVNFEEAGKKVLNLLACDLEVAEV